MRKMKKIDIPKIEQEAICASIPELQFQDRILSKSKEYLDCLEDLSAFAADEKDYESKYSGFTEHMKKMYSQRFSNARYKAPYDFYLKIRGSQESCPYCNYPTRFPSQIDHYLPKSSFPSFALTVENLVPACSDCNKNKSDIIQLDKSKRIIHPYFDEFANKSFDFIGCRIVEKVPIGFEFFIKKIPEIDEEQFRRLQIHFELLKLDKLYQADFNADFVSCMEGLKIMIDISDIGMVKKLICIRKEAQKKSGNKPWIYAGYSALFNSEWFFNTWLNTLNI